MSLSSRNASVPSSSARESLTPLRQCRPSFAAVSLAPTRNLITFVSLILRFIIAIITSRRIDNCTGQTDFLALTRNSRFQKVSCTETVLPSGILNECMGLRVLSIDDLTAALPQMRATAVLSLSQTRGNDKGGRSNGQIQSLLVSPSGPFQRGRVRTLDGSRSDSSPIVNTRQMAI